MQFQAAKMLQSKRERFLISIPFKDISREMFPGLLSLGKKVAQGEQQQAMQKHGQRALNIARAKAIASYLTKNRDDFVLPPIVLSIDGEFSFDKKKNVLTIDDAAKLHIVDGQHRTAGAILAYSEDNSLEFESLGAMVIFSRSKASDRQAFADINGNTVKVSLGKNVLFNSRDEKAVWVQNLADTHLSEFCDFEGNTPKRGKYFSAPGLYVIAKEFGEEHSFREFIDVCSFILKGNYDTGIFGSVVMLTSSARVAAMSNENISEHVERIYQKVDWSRDSWEGVCVFNGVLSKSAKLVTETAFRLKQTTR